jgi:hypothetical protein
MAWGPVAPALEQWRCRPVGREGASMGTICRCMSVTILSAVFVFASGCAFTVDQVPINFEFQETINHGIECSKTTSIGAITDTRPVDDPNLIVHKTNMHGYTTTGGYKAEKPLAEIIRDGLVQGFAAADLPVSGEHGDYTLRGEFMDYGYHIIMGLFDGKLNSRLTVRFTLVDNARDKIVWRDTFIGRATITKGHLVRDPFSLALTDLIRQVCSDELLLEYLE